MRPIKIKDLQKGKFPSYESKKDWELYLKEEVLNTIKIIKDKIRKLPNRDEKIQKFCKTNIMTLDGGGVGRFEVIKIIDEEFMFDNSELYLCELNCKHNKNKGKCENKNRGTGCYEED